jgi:tetratricopeptide (TPR) repeat protein
MILALTQRRLNTILERLYSPEDVRGWMVATSKLEDITTCALTEMPSSFHPPISPPDWVIPTLRQLVPPILDPFAMRLLFILHTLTQPTHVVQRSLLCYAGSMRKQWAPSGDLEDFSIEELGFDQSTAEMLRDTERLEHELNNLEKMQFIQQTDGDIHMLQSLVLDWNQWKEMTPLVCFHFTGCEYSDGFSKIGNAALPLFKLFIKEFTQAPADERQSCRRIILPALIQASKFSDLHWKRKCIDIVESEGVHNMDTYTRAYFVVRKAFVLRSEGDWDASFQMIRIHLALLDTADQNPQLRAVQGLLIHALASSLWEREDFQGAAAVWKTWGATTTTSLFEARVSIKILTGVGKCMLHERHFDGAVTSLRSALDQYDDGSRLRLDALATLSDTYCEMGMSVEALRLLELDDIPNIDPNDRYYLNCYIAYAQALVCDRQHKRAEATLLKLRDCFGSDLLSLDRHDRRRQIRVALLHAQNSHLQADDASQWQQTSHHWDTVIQSLVGFDEVASPDAGMIFFSKHHAIRRSGSTDIEWYKRGMLEFSKAGRFWMRGMTTYWMDYLLSELPYLTEIGINRGVATVPSQASRQHENRGSLGPSEQTS